MKKLSRLFFVFLACQIAFVSCKTQRVKFEFIDPKSGQSVSKGQEVPLRLRFPDTNLDSVVYSVDGSVIASKTDTSAVLVNTADFAFGSRSLTAKLYYQGEESIAYSNVVIVPPAPKLYSFEVINTFPHDSTAFTQGLQYENGILYESTGQLGKSSLRKVELATGKVLQKIDLDEDDFGEGLAIVGNKIVLLTWLSEKGYVYNKRTFALEGSFNYPKGRQGWGLTYDGSRLIQSDGSSNLYFLDPNTYRETGVIQVLDNNGPVINLNELEYIDGKVYANLYYGDRDEVVIIDPNTGVVEGKINFVGLYDGVRRASDNEMNGIAYNASTGHLYVTGKYWTKLYEVRPIAR